MPFINIGNINIKFFIPVLGGIVRLVYLYIIRLNSKYEALFNNPFLLSIYTSIGMILAFIPYLIFKHKNKISNNIELKNESKLIVKLEHYDYLKKSRFGKYKLIAIASIFDFLNTFLAYVFGMNVVYNLWIFDIILISLFSYFILKTKLYRHQYFSMISIFVLGIILNIFEYYKLDESEDKINIFELSMKFLTEIFFSITIVIIKYNIDKYYCSPYLMCLWEGFLGLILHIITLVIINALGLTIDNIKYPENLYDYIIHYDFNDFLVSLIIIIVSSIFNISLMLTCFYFTPAHVLISSIIKETHYYMHFDENVFLNIFGFLILLIILFMFFVFVEIIEINICNISFNTKKNIEIRSKNDSFFDMDYILDSSEEILPDEDINSVSTLSTINETPL